MSKAVRTFKLVQGEWLFNRILGHLNMTEKEFEEKYGDKLEDDPTCLNDEIVEMMRKNMTRGMRK